VENRTFTVTFKIVVLAALLGLLPTFAVAQGYDFEAHESSIAVGVGIGYMFSDAAATINPHGFFLKDFTSQDLGYAATAEYRKYLRAGLAYVVGAEYTNYRGTKDSTRHPRDYQYLSHVGEISYVLNLELFSFFSQQRIPIDVYGLAGVGVVGAYIPKQSFSPTSGRPNAGDKTSNVGVGVNAIFGVGLRVPLTSLIDLRIEGSYHTGTCDYLDGYLPYYSKHPDLCAVSVVKISFRLFNKSCNCFPVN
jgi:hypothetical protein